MSARVVCLGPQILDVLVRPVVEIPAGQGGALLEEARVTAAGTAAGTAVDLAKLGGRVTSVGAIGDDAAGRMVRLLLADHGVDTDHLVVKKGLQTSLTVLPIRPNGERPSLHARGATDALVPGDVDVALVREADFLHLGGPDVLGEFATTAVPELLREARAASTVTTLDMLRSHVAPDVADTLGEVWPLVDYFLPNDDQLRSLTGIDDLVQAAQRVRELGVGTVVVTTGADGSIVVSESGVEVVPALVVPVVDTTGCGDAYVAGFVTGLGLGWTPSQAARLGTVAAGLVAGGLGSDAGIVDLESTLRCWRDRADEVGMMPPGAERLPSGRG
ncbi:sugar/nucleoside kinase (ribokinase family) [Nocardioides zeae]|uniref:Sugar/nucleoside kinase (Ribokinase family) n=1 Tax=Nocardioides zeae TaxID=1457234 RepID=A0ACC6IE36_9ACTN|nr:PfkB family carbohydrate kinase [Nocardioides zeae]MDR6174184.1 sugar/nucleoside kinase (ribokinase family) [Nocardioides zeae]MDR6208991.1 sugar/nucleoside kinase (ribokinase family) [Nocardioides zeae]